MLKKGGKTTCTLLKTAFSFAGYKHYYYFVSIHISLAAHVEVRTLYDK